MSTLGERIRKVRTNNSLKQEDFAKSLSVSRSFISRVESDKERASETVIKLISLQYNVSLDWLMYGKGEYIVDAYNDYFERGYRQEYRTEIIPAFKGLLDALDSINSSSLFLSVVAIMSEYTQLLNLYEAKKNLGVVVFDRINDIIIDLLNTVKVCEKNKDNELIEKHFYDLSEQTTATIDELKKTTLLRNDE